MPRYECRDAQAESSDRHPPGQIAEGRPAALRAARPVGHAPPLAGGLYLVATPIGNLRDITVRALEVLAAADLIACEDTRVTGKLLEHYGIETPLTPYHEHNAAEARPKLLARLAEGAAVALVSDAGTPLVSDPGFQAGARSARSRPRRHADPGRLGGAGGAGGSGTADRSVLLRGIPAAQGSRSGAARIAEIGRIPATLVLFESGPRLAATLADLAAALGPREAAVCRELTKLHEEVRRGDLAALARDYARPPEPRGEIVIVDRAAGARVADGRDIDALLRKALAALR